MGLQVVDAWAAEHLEVVTRDARAVAARVRNAGAIFVGPWAPVNLGDYLAGSKHVLATGGTARFTGGLSVQAFQRMIHVVDYEERALAEVASLIDALGGAEDFFFSSRRRHTRFDGDWSSDVCSSDLRSPRRATCSSSCRAMRSAPSSPSSRRISHPSCTSPGPPRASSTGA